MRAHRVRLTPRLLRDARAQEDLLRAIREERTEDALFGLIYDALKTALDRVDPGGRPPWDEGP